MGKRIIFIGLSLLLVLIGFMQPNHPPAHAETVEDVEEKIDEIKKEQMELKQEENTIKDKKSNTSTQIQENLTEQSATQKELTEIDNSLAKTEESIATKETEIKTLNNKISDLTDNITEIEDEIDTLHNEIDKMNDEIDDLHKRILKREEVLKDRLRSMQSSGGNIKYLEVLLGSRSFSDFISRTAAVTKIMKQDKTMMEEHKQDKITLQEKLVVVEEKNSELKENRAEVVAKKADIENNKQKIENEKRNLVTLRQDLKQQANEKDRLLGQLMEEQEDLEEYELSLEEEQKIIAAQGPALDKARQLAEQDKERLVQLAKEEEEARKKEEEKGEGETPPPPEGNKIFIKPAEGRHTSGYGMRWHPIHNRYTMHNGIDIANNTGTEIKAASSGVVSDARFMKGFGKTVIIVHSINGETFSTLYAHLNKITVSAGQVVQTGDKIGEMGNTGDSTGPHLHFEVHRGGYAGVGVNNVNPMPLIINP